MTTNQNASGEPVNTSGDPEEEKNQTPETVRYDTHRKLLGEKKELQEKYRKLEEEKKKLEEERLEKERKDLEAQGNYKKLLEQREDELKKEREEKNSILKEIQDARKKQAILKHISGVVPHKIHMLLPVDMVTLDENGSPDETSSKAAAQYFEQEYAFAIQRDVQNGGLPNEEAKGGGEKLPTYEEWQKLPAAKQRKLLPEMLAAGRLK